MVKWTSRMNVKFGEAHKSYGVLNFSCHPSGHDEIDLNQTFQESSQQVDDSNWFSTLKFSVFLFFFFFFDENYSINYVLNFLLQCYRHKYLILFLKQNHSSQKHWWILTTIRYVNIVNLIQHEHHNHYLKKPTTTILMPSFNQNYPTMNERNKKKNEKKLKALKISMQQKLKMSYMLMGMVIREDHRLPQIKLARHQQKVKRIRISTTWVVRL